MPHTYEVNVEFTSNEQSNANVEGNNINIFLQKSDNYKTILMIIVSFFAHEYTHFIRSKSKTYNYSIRKPKNDYEYFLNPEEMIAFHNQLVIESFFRNILFKKCLEQFIKGNIKDENVARRFRKGVIVLNTTTKFVPLKSHNVEISIEIKNNLYRMSKYLEKWPKNILPELPSKLNELVADIDYKLGTVF